MAFGFGFNKQKVLSAAEKFVQQGKLQNAIAEYEKIRKHDEKDLTVANTIGDLYSRLGDTPKAIDCFKAVGDAYAAQGFTVKGIAMYKKITKLQPSMDGSLKLAELYTQQGLFNDARAQYLQVAEDFMKNGDLEQAVRLFQKVLEMDPENAPMRVKLAEVYVRLGRKKEAWEIFSAAAESLRARGSLAAAEDILQRMLALDPSNTYVLLLRGRAALESDDPKTAIQYLEKAADIDSQPEGLRDLLKAYLANGDLAKASPLADKLLTVHNDPEGLFLLAEGAARLGHYNTALDVYSKHSEGLMAADSARLLGNLHSLIAHVQDDSGALEQLLGLLNQAGENTHVNEVTELLAHASVKDGKLERAGDLYKMLAASEPQNALHAQNYHQVVERMEGSEPAVTGITAEEGALIVEELEATAPMIAQTYPDHTAVALRSAITDADLFLSYNLPDKAMVPLLRALPSAPRDVRLNQRLTALHTRFQRFAEAAACCHTLESVYHDAGHPDEALRYGELAARYEHSADSADAAEAASAEATAVPTAAHTFEITQAAHADFPVEQEIAPAAADNEDISSEWEHSLAIGDDQPAAEEVHAGAASQENNPEIDEAVEEIRFYLEHSMRDQARTAFEKLETLTHDVKVLGPLRTAIESAAVNPAEESEPEIAEIPADDPATLEFELEAPSAEAVGMDSALSADHGQTHSAPADMVEATVSEPPHEQSMEAIAAQPESAKAHAETSSERNDLNHLVAELETLLGDSFLEPSAHDAPHAPVHATNKSAQVQPAEKELRSAPLPGWPGAVPANHVAAAPSPVQPAVSAGIDANATAAREGAPAIAASAAAAAAGMSISQHLAPMQPASPQVAQSAASVDLTEMFGELKHELEQGVSTSDDDPETHYNLGVAFREMGLLDEAIAELQKVCAAIEQGHRFTQTVQAYTWLAQCFLDKGVPDAAIRWYEKALNIPELDGESRVAINYELGSACESAHDKPGALRHFTYVYGANIDYRDVAERIQALKS
jgi:tetratricopeptide (TPR) repeat protein